jgi:hypothetical protein
VLSRGSDTVQRVVLDPTQGRRLGSPQNKQIELNTTPAGSAGPCQTRLASSPLTPAPARS